jgi:hypothetical protein
LYKIPIHKNMKKGIVFLILSGFIKLTISQSTVDLNSQKVPKKEVYKSFYEFKTGLTSIADPIYIDSLLRKTEKWKGTYSLIPRYSKSHKEIKNIWGFCDGRKYYIFHNSEFFAINFKDQQMIFTGYGIPDMTGVAAAGGLGGAIGGGIYGAVAAANAKNEKHIYFIGPYTGRIYETKELLNKQESLYSTAELIFYRTSKGERTDLIEFKVSDSLLSSFMPDSYKKIVLPMSFQPVKISYGSGFSNSFEIYLSAEELKYFKCSYPVNDSLMRLTEVSITEGEFDSYKTMKEQNKREKKLNKQNEIK